IIIPGQREMVRAKAEGRPFDPVYGLRGKQRSVHNNYFTLPVLFIMISHHYPMTYGADRPWLVLALLGATGVAIRQVFTLRHKHAPTGRWIALAVVLALASVTYVAAEKASHEEGTAGNVTYADIQPILARHCYACHGAHPTNPAFPSPPLGVKLDTAEHVAAVAPRIKAVAVEAVVMPLGNSTGMTKAERAQIGAWIAAGARP
ncbi:MAG TPA: urate hydroxylase PuuD, partial [Novosphingobium sp.]|nr:urate hydroxylase PuuD [Novosphingobium sp.]